jgi:chromosome segregation ATPase
LTEKSDQQLIEINQLNNQNAILNEQSEQQLNEINKLKNENNLLNDKIKEIQIENKQLNENCIQQSNEINHLKSEYKSLEDQCNQYQIKINDDENSLKNLVKSFQDKQNNFNLIENDNENLSQYLQRQQVEIEFLNKQIQELKQFEYIQRDYRNLHQLYQQQQIESLRQFNQQSIYIELIQTENEQLKQESIQYQIRIEQLIIEIKRLEAKLNKPIFQSKGKTYFIKLTTTLQRCSSQLKCSRDAMVFKKMFRISLSRPQVNESDTESDRIG